MTTQEESPGPDLTQCSRACHATDKLKISAVNLKTEIESEPSA